MKFHRFPARPLPDPEAGDLVERLRGFVNVSNEDEFKLIVSWLVAALWPGRPFPILIVNGVQGCKSVLCRLLRSLIDPDVAMIYAAPKDERDLVLAASNTWVQGVDNLSSVNGFLPDALCRLASGSGFRTRALHTNRDEFVFSVQWPILLNGIPITSKPMSAGAPWSSILKPSLRKADKPRETSGWSLHPSAAGSSARFLKASPERSPRSTASKSNAPARWPTSKSGQWPRRLRSAGRVRNSRRRTGKIRLWWSTTRSKPMRWRSRSGISSCPIFGGRMGRNTDRFADRTGHGDARAHPKLTIMAEDAIPARQSDPAGSTAAEHKGFIIDRRHSGTRMIVIVPPRQ